MNESLSNNALINQIIEKIQSVSLLKNKCRSLERIFQKISEIIDSNSEDDFFLNNNLYDLNDILDDLNCQNLVSSFFTKYQSIDSLLTKINDIVKLIFKDILRLHNLIFSLPPYDDFEDIQVLDFKSRSFQTPQIREEIKQKYEQSKIPFLSLIKKYQKTNLTERNYKIISNDTHSNLKNSVDIFQGETDSNEKVRVTVIKDRNKFETMFPILATIDHPYFEKYIGVSITNSGVELVTKVPEDTLSNHMSDPNFCSTIFAFKIAQAMSYLHSNRIIHCELNPSNIFIDQIDIENPTKVTPIISNFFNSLKLTKNSLLGMPNITPTSPFCAPELTHNYFYDEKVDVFAFGGILYQFLTNKKPFEEMSYDQMRSQILNGKRPEIPGEFSTNNHIVNLIKMCWAQNPRKRCSFDQIIDKMSSNEYPVIFPSDEGRRDEILNLYSQSCIQNKIVSDILSLMENIIKDSSYVFQFKYTFAGIQTKLIEYKAELRKSEIAFKNEDYGEEFEDDDDDEEEEEEENFENVLSEAQILKKLQDSLYNIEDKLKIVGNYEEFEDFYAQNDGQFQSFIKKICRNMSSIGSMIKKLNGENSVTNYQIDSEDLSNDFGDIIEYGYCIMDPIENLPERSFDKQLYEILNQYQSKKVDPSDFYYESLHFSDGATAFVHKGVQISTNSKVAIKILKNEFKVLKDLIYLRREIGYLTRLKSVSSESSKYIADFIGYSYTDKGAIWMIFEYKNNDLYQIERKLTAFEKTKIAFEIAKAIEYLHSQNIFHRDLKTSNIVVDDDGTPLLIDFGYSQSDMRSLPMTEQAGTAHYMAPEVIYNKEGNYTRKIDIFSYAMILWELFHNTFPFSNHKHTVSSFTKYQFDIYEKMFTDGVKEIFEGNDLMIQEINNVANEVFLKVYKRFLRLSYIEDVDKFHGIFQNYLDQFRLELENQNKELSNQFNAFVNEQDEKLVENLKHLLYFINSDDNEFVKEIIHAKYRPEFKEDIPKDLKELIEEAWSQDPQKRPTIKEIIQRMITRKISFLPDNSTDLSERKLIEEFYHKIKK